ncbi:hypothetical protein BD410DRAFT_820696 [Rickenella mellea]|uniref:ADF-H domain-containing protein n=1 Tax=Rickenella mellea TaxID=50990 RepID=A0A4Y7Q8I4_9AGAM|nr:hypothetical protein BD410DRAFT_820696 [Rickenella mellea]
MSVDLNDPNITAAYESITKQSSTDWLLLSYGQTRDRLALFASGEGGIDALRSNIPSDAEDVFFGFCREAENGKNYYVLISYVPEAVSGVRRARALVHSRAVGALLKANQGTLSVNNIDQLNAENVRDRLKLGPSFIPRATSNGLIQRSASEPVDQSAKMEASGSTSPITTKPLSPPTPPKAPMTMKRIVSQPQSQSIRRLMESDDDEPPPTPPKDKFSPYSFKSGMSPQRSSEKLTGSISAHSQPSRPQTSGQPSSSSGNDSSKVLLSSTRARSASAPRKPTPRSLSPGERARLRAEAQKQRELDEQKAIQEEAERQARLKREKQETLRQAELEEERRRIAVEEEKRYVAAERARKEAEREAEEERLEQEAEAKRQADKARRLQEARRLEELRKEEERRKEEAAKIKEEERKRAEAEKSVKMKEIQSKFVKGSKGANPVLLSGYVTVQTSASIAWKRRFFELHTSALILYKDSKERTQPVDTMDLTRGRVRAIREPGEGFEELEAIPFAFAVEFKDAGSWSLYSDSAEEKVWLQSTVLRFF